MHLTLTVSRFAQDPSLWLGAAALFGALFGWTIMRLVGAITPKPY